MSEPPQFSSDDHLLVNELCGTTLLGFDSTDVPAYARVYKDAGDTLIHRATFDFFGIFLLFPALYCYRHAVEIALKDIIHVWGGLQTGALKVERTHKLNLLWSKARPAVAMIWPASDPDQLELVGALIGELAVLDPDGFQLRYAIDTRGRSRPIPPELAGVDLDNLRDATNRLIAFLIGAGVELAEYARHRA